MKLHIPRTSLLLLQVFVVATCSLTYELILGTASSFISGSSILAYSLAIGLFLSGLGVGAFVSRWITDKRLADTFVWTETLLALVGGGAVLLLYFSYIFTPYFLGVQIGLTLIIGMLSGLEIPVLTRLLDQQNPGGLKGILANVLSFDYVGGLVASLLFPLLLLPFFGLVRLNFLVGVVNLVMAGVALWLFWHVTKAHLVHLLTMGVAVVLLILGAIFSQQVYGFVESYFYRDPIIYSQQTQYQHLVFTKKGTDLRLFINGNIQFSTLDEYRYHESLVMPAMIQNVQKCFRGHYDTQNPSGAQIPSAIPTAQDIFSQPDPIQTPYEDANVSGCHLNVAILGGGDGLAVRELLKFEPFIDHITVVDIDPEMTRLARDASFLQDLNQNSLNQPKVQVRNEDAWLWLKNQPRSSIDVLIGDLPDPDSTEVARLYSQEFFTFAQKALKPTGILVTQSSSPYQTPKVFWTTHRTLNSVFANVFAYTTYVPSFGLWGFNLVPMQPNWNPYQLGLPLPVALEQILNKNAYASKAVLQQNFQLPPDIAQPTLDSGEKLDIQRLPINTLDNLVITTYARPHGSEVV